MRLNIWTKNWLAALQDSWGGVCSTPYEHDLLYTHEGVEQFVPVVMEMDDFVRLRDIYIIAQFRWPDVAAKYKIKGLRIDLKIRDEQTDPLRDWQVSSTMICSAFNVDKEEQMTTETTKADLIQSSVRQNMSTKHLHVQLAFRCC